jgi:hypothetical protein
MNTAGSRRILAGALVVAGLLILAGCPILDNFEFAVDIERDGSYTVTYDGLVIAYSWIPNYSVEGELTAAQEEEMHEEYDSLFAQPGFRDVRYLGDAVFRVRFRRTMKAGESFAFLNDEFPYFVVTSTEDQLRLLSTSEGDDVKRIASEAGIDVDGTMVVTSRLPVAEHDADAERSRLTGVTVLTYDFSESSLANRKAYFSLLQER